MVQIILKNGKEFIITDEQGDAIQICIARHSFEDGARCRDCIYNQKLCAILQRKFHVLKLKDINIHSMSFNYIKKKKKEKKNEQKSDK